MSNYPERNVIRLPSAEEIMRRLAGANDTEALVKWLYPAVAKHAGEEKSPPGILMVFEEALLVFGEHNDPTVTFLARELIPRWAEALVDDQTFVGSILEGKKYVDDELRRLGQR